MQQNNTNINDLKINFLRQNISYVGQDTILFNDTIKNNISYGKKNVSDEQINNVLKQSYSQEFIKDMPEGINTEIGENGVLLSGGQRQRLAIARAFLKDAKILIFDEATSSLDTVSEKFIQKALDSHKEGRTTIVIAHRLSTVESANKINVMDNGKIVEVGNHKDLIKREGFYYKLYNSQIFK